METLRQRILCLFAAVLGATILTGPAYGQTVVEEAKVAAEINRVASNLPADSRTVITRLTLMRELPDGEWKMHSGDLAHGEGTNVDESGWESFEVPGKAPNDAVWFRQTYTVPDTI
jgi:alpha-mannosidase